MALFEITLALMLVAVLLLQLSRRLNTPYPTMLALAGAGVAALPFAPDVRIEPHLALALFIAPALLDAAYDTSPRELKRNWFKLVAMAVVAVLLTTAAVAWAGVMVAGLPLAAAITLGAIVAPPDAAAASAILTQLNLPRRAHAILRGESLLNDATALLIFTAAVALASSPGVSARDLAPGLVAAVPGGVLLGLAAAFLYVRMAPMVAGTLSTSILEFGYTFGVWVLAERLDVSAILAMVVFAMSLARRVPGRQTARDRVHSYAVWEAAVFVLNVLAFLLMGMQARTILGRLSAAELGPALAFSALVLGIVIVVRLVLVMSLSGAMRLAARAEAREPSHWRESLLVSWCGMRGLVTLATAFALPVQFPGRDVIVLAAFTVVLGTLVVQGLTLTPLIRLLDVKPDKSLEGEVSKGRTAMLDAALGVLAPIPGEASAAVQAEYRANAAVAVSPDRPQGDTEHDRLRIKAIRAQRHVIHTLRREGGIGDDAFHRLEAELDWAELNAAPRERLELEEA
jgi:CPA1 family monovalent cation:H+ antiporter